jgi:Uncharacterized protein conserved in bacteria
MSAKTKISAKAVRHNEKDTQSRLNFRLAPEIKNRIARAAALTGRDLTEFAVAALNEKADEVIDHHGHVLLDSREYHFFLEALSSTKITQPSARSIAAAKRYRRGKRKGVRYHLAD